MPTPADLSKHTDLGIIQRTPRVPALDGTHLNWLIAHYLKTCRYRLDTSTSASSYQYQLQWFVNWWETQGPPRDWLLRPHDFAQFERYLRSVTSPRTKRPLTYHTRLTVIKRLKEMFRWAYDNGYVERDYRQWIPSAEGGPPKRHAATIAQLRHLLEATVSLRNRAMVAMMMGMGLRRGEVASLDVEDVVVYADNSGYARVTGKRTRTNLDGKREAAFDSATGIILVTYLDALGRDRGTLFEGDPGRRISGSGIYVMLKKLIVAAGLETVISGPHDLRRAFATHYRRNRTGKGSADLLQRQLGHARFSTTTEYTLLTVDDIRADLVSPLALFDNEPSLD